MAESDNDNIITLFPDASGEFAYAPTLVLSYDEHEDADQVGTACAWFEALPLASQENPANPGEPYLVSIEVGGGDSVDFGKNEIQQMIAFLQQVLSDHEWSKDGGQ